VDILIQIAWAIAPGIVVGVVMAFFNRRQNERNAREDKLIQDRVEKEMLELDLLLATSQLSYAVAMAIKRGTPNGEMEVAMKQYDRAMGKFRKYERRKLAEDEA